NWRLRFFNMIPAYCITGGLAAISVYQSQKSFLHQPHTRLLLCWFITAFLLANHEIFIKPMQPLHFTRGYIWTSLFLLGLPALHILFNDWKEKRKLLIIVLFSITFLSDNFLWLINNFRTKATTPSTAYISHEQKKILDILRKSSSNKTLVIGRDEVVPYLATVFTKAYPWISHPFTTPFAEKKIRAYKNFLNNNTIDTAWKKRDVIFVLRKDDQDEWQRSLQMPLATTKLADTEHYIVLKTMIAD
ncbi:MAG TPA: hypothetical protein VEX63_07135, partial [Flavisolibacter sp.]|nr:hypothetical protein [Flavisolibacter sp.]